MGPGGDIIGGLITFLVIALIAALGLGILIGWWL